MSAPARLAPPDVLSALRRDGWLPRPPYTLPPGRPWIVALIGAPGSAGVTDFTTTVAVDPGIRVICVPCVVSRPASVHAALRSAAALHPTAVAIVRGGGDQVTAFDDPGIVMALARYPIYTVLGVGHATDVVAAGAAVDHEAITPTAAAYWFRDQRRAAPAR
jgi:exonuclease VII large subunit